MATDGVLLLHGHASVKYMMWWMERRLQEAGYATRLPSYNPWGQLDGIVDGLEPKLTRFLDRFDGRLHIVSHSMGGLVARALIRRTGRDRLGRVVMLAPPNNGSEFADLVSNAGLGMLLGGSSAQLLTRRPAELDSALGPVDFDLGVIAGDISGSFPFTASFPMPFSGPHDGLVSVDSTRIAGMADHVILPVQHTSMPFSGKAARQAIAFLRDGKFQPPG